LTAPAGVVSHLNWTGTSYSVLLEWAPPEDNPQCVSSYLVQLEDPSQQSIPTTETRANLTDLIPCSNYSVIVSSLSTVVFKSKRRHDQHQGGRQHRCSLYGN
jgi:hypothetical protein